MPESFCSDKSPESVQSTSLFSSLSSVDKDKDKASCLSCVRLLQEILLSETSRPHRLLKSIAAPPPTANTTAAVPASACHNNNNNNEQTGASAAAAATAAPAIVVQRTATADTPHAVTVELLQPSKNATIPLQRQRSSRLHSPDSSSSSSAPVVNLATPSSISLFSASARRRSSLNKKNLTSPQLATSSVVVVTDDDDNAADAMTTAGAETLLQKITISCRSCAMTGPEGNARAFVMGPNPLSIVLCTNRLPHLASSASTTTTTSYHSTTAARQELEEVLTHELMHVYDVKQLQLDLRVCQNLAYSEVRAAREAECYHHSQQQQQQHSYRSTDWWNNNNNNNNHTTTMQQQQQEACVRSKALAATRNLFEYAAAQECVQAVFEKAMKDKRPFDQVPPLQSTFHPSSNNNSSSSSSKSYNYYRNTSSVPSER